MNVLRTFLIAGTVVLGHSHLRANDPLKYLATRALEVSIETAATGAAPIHGYQLWYTTDSGQSWQPDPTLHKNQGPIPFTAPADGRYGFLVVTKDLARRESERPQPGTPPEVEIVVDTTAPRIVLGSPTESAPRVFAGTELLVEWQTYDDHSSEKPVRLQWRRVSGQPWREMERMDRKNERFPAEGELRWFAPLVDGTFEFRLSVEDLAGNEAEWLSPPVKVVPFDGFRGSRTIAADPFTRFHSFPVHYRLPAQDDSLLVRTVEIWYRIGAGPWQRKVDRDRTSPYVFEAPDDAVYYLYWRALDLNGNATRPAPGPDTPPDYRVVVDTHSPEVQLLIGDGTERQAHTAGEALEIQWLVHEENLAPSSARLEVSLNGGANWHLLKDGLDTVAGRGSYSWRTMLWESESLVMRLTARDLAQNETVAMSPTRLRLINPRLDPKETADFHYRRAMILARTQDRDGDGGTRPELLQALESLDLALLYDSNHPEAWHDQGVILSMLGRHEDALESYEKAHELRPGSITFSFHLVRGYLNMADVGATGVGTTDEDYVTRATRTLLSVDTEAIYKEDHTVYRDLLNQHRALKRELADRGRLQR